MTNIITSIPYTFTPNTVIFSAQVNADFLAIQSQVNANAAGSGVNSDITALTALTSPPGGLGSQIFTGGTATAVGGNPNTLALATTTPSGFTLVAGKRITFIIPAANTGPMTFSGGGTTTTAVLKLGPSGLTPFVGGEYQAGDAADFFYDGTQYQAINAPTVPSTSNFYVGEMKAIAWDALTQNNVPAKWLVAAGQVISRTTYSALFGVIGTVYGAGDGSTTFAIPNLQGQFLRGYDYTHILDPGRVFGSLQADGVIDHTHNSPAGGNPFALIPTGSSAYASGGDNLFGQSSITGLVTSPNGGGLETRPKNIAMLWIIYAGV